MKVLHIIDSGGLYGAEVMLLNLIDEQIKLGLQPTICSIGKHNISEKPLESEALKRGFKLKKFRMHAGPNIFGAWKILQFAHHEHFDLIHTHGYKGRILFGLIPQKIRRLPLITTLHGWTNTRLFSLLRIYEWLEVKSLKYCDAVVIVSSAMRSNSRLKYYKKKNLTVINNGIPLLNLEVPTNKYNDELYLNSYALDLDIKEFCESGFIVGTIGRLSPEKGFHYLIEAISLLNNTRDIKLLIIGEGPLRAELEILINSLSLSEKVFIAGYRVNANKYLSLFDAFVLPSLSEGLPLTILEAMSAKTPIVATTVGGIPEVLQNGQGGLMVEPKNPKSLADAILKIRNNRALTEQLVFFSHNEVLTKYSSKTMAIKYLEMYKSSCKN
ncbi:MAG: hypothetical protein A3K22_04705 [Deltaproteobacteria bacterium RBG_16_42_7]|nr:MAG: hypothetical protein A3K22_04705 [Deltaproteobacteria bacterium RBG_16_42_7]